MAPPYTPVGGNFVPVIRISAAVQNARTADDVGKCCVFMDQSVNQATAALTPTCPSYAISMTYDPDNEALCEYHRVQKESSGAILVAV